MGRGLIRHTLFRLDPERAHNMVMGAMAGLSHVPLGMVERRMRVVDPRLEQQLFGRTFPNPVGLAAGFDKQAAAVPMWARLGFGFCEVGTITGRPQPGNPKPRIFRLPEDEAVINRLGFNSQGSERVAKRIAGWEEAGVAHRIPLGINIGKTKDAEDAAGDYLASFRRLARFADYVAVNVSSPNTPGLRDLQERGALEELLGRIAAANRVLEVRRPLLVKIAPDLDDAALEAIIGIAREHVDGLIICNTTIGRDGLTSAARDETGGLSGRPLRERSDTMIRRAAAWGGGLPIIGVGGIFSGEDAWNKILAGASLVQVYTGFVYEGPSLVKRINRDLLRRMDEAGIRTLSEAVGRG